MNVVAKRQRAVFASDFEKGIVGDDLADMSLRGSFILVDRATRLVRGSLNVQAFENDARNVSGANEQVEVVSFDGEFADRNERRRAVRAQRMSHDQVFGDTAGMRKVSDMKFCERDLAVKGFFERLANAIAGEGEMQNKDGESDSDQNDEGNGGSENPAAPLRNSLGLALRRRI